MIKMNITNTVTNRAMQLAGRQRQLSTSTASNAQHIPPKKWHIINRSMYPIILNFSCLWGKCLRKPLQKCDAEKGHAACHQQTSVADLKGWHLADITQRYQSHVKKNHWKAKIFVEAKHAEIIHGTSYKSRRKQIFLHSGQSSSWTLKNPIIPLHSSLLSLYKPAHNLGVEVAASVKVCLPKSAFTASGCWNETI